jgi:HEPN domain-containing protein
MREITGEWLAAAILDLETIAAIIDNGNLTGIVAFHAQQAMEKTLKAVLEETRVEFPKVHKLQTLFALLPERFCQDYDLFLIKTLDGLYIDARYPGEFGLLPNGKPSLDDANKFFAYAQEFHARITQSLENEQP